MGRKPKYPKFKKITLKDSYIINEYIDDFASYCEFGFSHLYLSKTPTMPSVYTFLNGNLVVKIKDYETNEYILTFLGTSKVEETIHTLLNDLSQNICYVPEDCLTKKVKNDPSLKVTLDRNNSDYIYKLQNLSNLSGKQLKSKRGKINSFTKKYPHASIVELDLSDKANRQKIMRVTRRWAKRKKELGINVNLPEYVTKYLRHNKKFNTVSYGLFLNGKMIGFSVNELAHAKTVRGIFGVVDIGYTGAPQYMEWDVAKKLFALGYEFLNMEQDLGIKGLSDTKRGWNPSFMLHKYIIEKK